MPHGPLLLPIGLVSLLIQVAFADSVGFSVLKNKEGDTPCDLQEAILQCKGPSRRALHLFPRETPPANRCTCTNVFWNLWSTCIASSGNQTSMEFSGDWNQICEKNQLAVKTHATADGVDELKGLDIPEWAFAGIPPENTTFDFATAIRDSVVREEEEAAPHWSSIQTVVPVLSGVFVAFICGILFYLYRRRKNGSRNRSSGAILPNIIRGGFWAHKVRKESRRPSWVIDGRNNTEEIELVPKSPSSTGATYGGRHIRLSSSPTPLEPNSTPSTSTPIPPAQKKQPESALPGTRLWRDSKLARNFRRGWLLLRLPFKETPVEVHSSPPSHRFEIDASNKSVRTNSTLENYRRGGFRTTSRSMSTESGGGATTVWDYSVRQDTIFEDDEDDNDSLGLGLGGTRVDDEQQRLIPRNNNTDVLVISHPSRKLTIESIETASHSLQVDPPSPVRSSPSTPIAPPLNSSSHSRIGSRFRHTPPAPSYPAPLPPPSPSRSPPREERPSIESVLSEPPVVSAPTLLSSPTNVLPSLSVDMTDPTPLYTNRKPVGSAHQNQHSRPPGISHQNPLPPPNRPIPPPPFPPSLRPSISEQRLHAQRSAEQLVTSAHADTDSSSNLSQYGLLSSPPYRSSPLPEEISIARGGPAFLPSGLRDQERSHPAEHQGISSPPYQPRSPPFIPILSPSAPIQINGHQKNHREAPFPPPPPHVLGRRELPLPPGIQLSPRIPHQRMLSIDETDHDHLRPPFIAPNELPNGARRASSESILRPLPSVNDDTFHPSSLLPGAFQAGPAGGKSSIDPVPLNGSTGLRTVIKSKDPRWYPAPSIG